MNVLVIDWQGVVSEIPYLCKWIIFLTFVYFMSKELGVLWMKNRHEKKLKEMAFEQEKYKDFWKELVSKDKIDKLEKQYESELEIKLLKERINLLQSKYKDMHDFYHNHSK